MSLPDYLEHYRDRLPVDKIAALRAERRRELLELEYWAPYRELERGLPKIEPAQFGINNGTVFLRSPSISEANRESYLSAAKSLIPWRKGPFNLFDIEIDAEWRSDQKWDRITPFLEPVSGKRVLDIGCNNGYYLFRLMEQNPGFVLGIDPSSRCLLQFELFQRYAQIPELAFELFGVEDVDLYPDFFHTVLCMGIIYHNRSPLTMLQKINNCMRPGGQLILESAAIPGDLPISLSPPDRYGKMRNVWFIPTAACMASWLKAATFVDTEVVSSVILDPTEQRKTQFSPWESLSDYLDPADPSKTVEGYPAPLRVTLTARKRE